jgi:hypothetical protein
MKTWRVLGKFPGADGSIPLQCHHCDQDAECPTRGRPGALLIAILGMGLVFDPPGHVPPDDWMPREIQCRKCRRIYTSQRTGES